MNPLRAVLVVLAVTLAGSMRAQAQAPEPRSSDMMIVAIVEGEPITSLELDIACNLISATRSRDGTTLFHQLPEGSREKQDYRKQILERGLEADPATGQPRELSLVLQKVLLQKAKELKVELTALDDERLNRELAQVAEGRRGGMDGLRAALKDVGVPFDFFVQRKRDNLLITKLLLTSVSHAIFPTPAEVRRRYEEKKAKYEREGELRLRYLRIDRDPEDTSVRSPRRLGPKVGERLESKTWDAAAFAAELRAEIASGALPFEEAQRLYSMDRFHDREMVFRTSDPRLQETFNPPLPEHILRLASGELSQVIDGGVGLFLVLLVDRQERTQIPLEEVQSDIEMELKDEVWRRRRDAWIDDARANAHIETFLPPGN